MLRGHTATGLKGEHTGDLSAVEMIGESDLSDSDYDVPEVLESVIGL